MLNFDTPTPTEPQPAVCEWCGAWFHTAHGARFCSAPCAKTAYRAMQDGVVAAKKRDELQRMVSRGLLDADVLDIWGTTPRLDTDALAGIRDHVLNKGRVITNAWVSGGPGTGKTFACLFALLSAWEHGQTVAQASIQQLIADGKWGPNWDTYQKVDVLLIDDMDKLQPKDGYADALWTICNTRRSRRARTLVTSNLTGSEWARRWTGEVATEYIQPCLDRLLPCVGIKCSGKNLRREAAKEVT